MCYLYVQLHKVSHTKVMPTYSWPYISYPLYEYILLLFGFIKVFIYLASWHCHTASFKLWKYNWPGVEFCVCLTGTSRKCYGMWYLRFICQNCWRFSLLESYTMSVGGLHDHLREGTRSFETSVTADIWQGDLNVQWSGSMRFVIMFLLVFDRVHAVLSYERSFKHAYPLWVGVYSCRS